MKLSIPYSIFLLALTTTAFANPNFKDLAPLPSTGKLYLGVFGGGGSSSNFNASQYGTAFYSEALGGPLAVNAFGTIKSRSTSLFGAQIGYWAPEIFLSHSSQLTLIPAAELEGYYMGSSSFNGDLSNNTARLPEHDFLVTYPMSRTVFLANAIVSFNHPSLFVHPYIGLGIGNALLRISGATATQVSPPEVGVNHYNTNTSDNSSTFAGQIKLGLGYDINQFVTLFAEYRWLYLASTHFVFGSTAYTGHVETSSWQVSMGSQRYNMGNVGIRFNV